MSVAFPACAIATALVLATPARAELPRSVQNARQRLSRSWAPDAGLDAAAARHAREIASDDSAANIDRVHAALRESGLPDPWIIPFAGVGTSTPALSRALLRFASERASGRGVTHHGLAVVAGPRQRTALVALFARRLADLPPLPLAPEPPAVVLSGQTRPKMDRLSAYLTGPGGLVEDLPVDKTGRRFGLEVPFTRGPGRYTFELLTETARGPEVVALWDFFVGVPPGAPGARHSDRDLPDTTAALEALIRRARTQDDLPDLGRDPGLDRAAGLHARAVCRTMLAAHVFPGSGSPADRARRAGFEGPVSENVAIAATVERAHANLLASPAHRKNVLDRGARVMGLGVASRRGSVCVVELFGGQPRSQGR